MQSVPTAHLAMTHSQHTPKGTVTTRCALGLFFLAALSVGGGILIGYAIFNDDNDPILVNMPGASPSPPPPPPPPPPPVANPILAPVVDLGGIRKVEGQCPVGTYERVDSTTRVDSASGVCRLNFALPNDLDASIMETATDKCSDFDTFANGKWNNGDAGRNPPFAMRTWDSLTRDSEKLLGEIEKVEALERIWSDGALNRYTTTCISELAQKSRAGWEYHRSFTDEIIANTNDYHGLMSLWGRMGRYGFITPMDVSVERKHPYDHTKRMLFVSQSGLLGVDPNVVYLPQNYRDEYNTHVQDLEEIITAFGLDANAPAAARRIVAMEEKLVAHYGTSQATDYLSYVEEELPVDEMTYTQLRTTIDPTWELDLSDYTDALFAFNATHGPSFAKATSLWVFKPSFFSALATAVKTFPVADWLLHARVSMAVDAQHFVPLNYIYHAHRVHRAFAPRRAPPSSGIRDEWLLPFHSARKQRWRTMAPVDRDQLPGSVHFGMGRTAPKAKSEGLKRAVKTKQGLDSFEGDAEHSIYRDVCGMLAWTMLQTRFEKIYVETLVLPDDYSRLRSLVAAIQEQAVVDINASGLSETTKDMMRRKINKLRVRIGAPNREHWKDPAEVIDGHAAREKDTSLLEMTYRVRERTIQHGLERLLTPPGPEGDAHKNPFLMSVAEANAYYDPGDQTINILAGISRHPMYHHDYSDAALFAKVGGVVAHEIGHSLDPTGMMFDDYGNVREWPAQEDMARISDDLGCLIDQYSKPTKYGNMHDGDQTIGENVADNLGIKWAFRAWVAAEKKRNPQFQLTAEGVQLFATLYAQVWAEKTSYAADAYMTNIDTHSRPEFRIREVLRNIPEVASLMCGSQPVCTLLGG